MEVDRGLAVDQQASILIDRLCHSLRVAKKSIDLFGSDGFRNPDNTVDVIRPEKIVGETAFLILAATTCNFYKDVKSAIDELAACLIPLARDKKTQLNICLYPSLALDFAQAHVCLAKAGFPDQEFDQFLSKSLDAHSSNGRERPAHRMLEQEWIKKTAGFASDPSVNQMISMSALGKPIDLLYGTREDVYAFTHALMYVSDFNMTPWQLPRSKSDVLNEAEAMIAKALDEQDYDLCGEILLSWPLTGFEWSAVSIFAFQVLMDINSKAGFLPSPGLQMETFESMKGEERSRYLYGTTYHTIYVMGLLSAVCLQEGRMPPHQISADDSPQLIFKVTDLLGQNQNERKHWMDCYDRLSFGEQTALGGFLLNVSLIRGAGQRDFAKLWELLRLADEQGLADTPICRQAAELLDRLTVGRLT